MATDGISARTSWQRGDQLESRRLVERYPCAKSIGQKVRTIHATPLGDKSTVQFPAVCFSRVGSFFENLGFAAFHGRASVNSRDDLMVYSRALANARPDPDFRYFSKAIARASSVNAT